MFSIFKKQWHVTGNEDASSLERYTNNSPTPTMTRFPTLRISKDGEKAEIFHLPLNDWSSVSMPYALANGTSWPSELLSMPKIQAVLDKIKPEEEVPAILQMPPQAPKIAA